jgi:ectoine hydroxylase-related dioxygenase (phytanoyl-CoA dioxygenase family)
VLADTPLVNADDNEGAMRALVEVGYCIVPGVLGADELAVARAALDREAAEDDAAGIALRYGPDASNQRLWALLNRGEEFVPLATHPLALEVVRARMGPDVLLSNLSANITGPGGDHEIGRLHTDQGFLPEPWPYLLATNVMWFLDDFTERNGATVVVPRSHRTTTIPPADLAPSAPACLAGPAGSMAVVDGRLHHATGLNRTRDQRRRGILATYCLPFLRTQENWCRSLDPDVLGRHPDLAALTGFEEWQTLGSVNGPTLSGLNF